MKLLVKICCGICLLACSKANTGSSTIIPLPQTGPQKTWLALGDSYTIGQGVTEPERFPAQTANRLLQSGISIGTPDYIAATGWTTDVLSNNITAQNPGTYNVVSLLIGVNDQYQRRDTTGYRQRFTGLLLRAIQIANGKKENVFVLSIPDYSVTPYAAGTDTARIRRELDWFNAINKNVTDAYRCPYLDITGLSREARYNSNLIAADGLHPSGLQYRYWAEKLAPLMRPVLQ